MLYTGKFSSNNNKVYQIDIVTDGNTTPWDGESGEITLSGTPCIISTYSDGLFSPIKSRSATIEMVSTEYHMDLYQPSARGAKVSIYDITTVNNPKKIFHGYLTPCSYDQDFTYLDSIQLEAVDGISTSKEFEYQPSGNIISFLNIVTTIINNAGYSGWLYIPRSYQVNSTSVGDNRRILSKLNISDSNFIDNDEERSRWKEYEVLEEILKYLGLSLCIDGDDIWLIDYDKLVGGLYFDKYKLNSGQGYSSDSPVFIDLSTDINLSIIAGGTSKISIDDIYNKISISDNIYDIEDISPDISKEETHISVTKEIQKMKNITAPNQTQWTRTETTGALWWKKTNTSVTGYDFQTLCRLKPSTGWTHYFYDMNDLSCLTDPTSETYDGKEYYNPYTDTFPYNNNIINKYINTHGALLQHYAHLKEQGVNNIPATIDWTTCLTFFVTNKALGEGSGSININDIDNLELKVLEYNSAEAINWKPSSGTSWITIQGDLYYQYDNTNYNDGKDCLKIINDKQGEAIYFTAPVDKSVSIDSQPIFNLSRKPSNADYGLGFSCWKFGVHIGGKSWDGEKWVSDVSESVTFYVKYNNDPDGEEDEYVEAYSWMGPVNNVNYKDKVGVDGYCIKIDADDPLAPSFGKLKIEVFTPTIIPTEIWEMFKNRFNNVNISGPVLWNNLPPVIYAKDFKIGYVYSDTSEWWVLDSEENNKNDKVYVGYIDTNYVQDFNTLELKINTSTKDKPIAKSYVTTDNGFLSTMQHGDGSSYKIQEYNIIDNYLNHYSDRKIIFECNVHGLHPPYETFTKSGADDSSYLPGNYVIDSYQYDLSTDNNRIKFIQY